MTENDILYKCNSTDPKTIDYKIFKIKPFNGCIEF